MTAEAFRNPGAGEGGSISRRLTEIEARLLGIETWLGSGRGPQDAAVAGVAAVPVAVGAGETVVGVLLRIEKLLVRMLEERVIED